MALKDYNCFKDPVFLDAFKKRLSDRYFYVCFLSVSLIGVLLYPVFDLPKATPFLALATSILIFAGWSVMYVFSVVFSDFFMLKFNHKLRGFLALWPMCLFTTIWSDYWLSSLLSIELGWDGFLRLFWFIVLCATFTRGAEMSSFEISNNNPRLKHSPFLRRLETRGTEQLVQIEAQDHYLKVTTETKIETIRMRLADAIEELEGQDGLQVHRSHWVSLPMVESVRKEKSKCHIELKNGSLVPVSKPNIGKVDALAKERNWPITD